MKASGLVEIGLVFHKGIAGAAHNTPMRAMIVHARTY